MVASATSAHAEEVAGGEGKRSKGDAPSKRELVRVMVNAVACIVAIDKVPEAVGISSTKLTQRRGRSLVRRMVGKALRSWHWVHAA